MMRMGLTLWILLTCSALARAEPLELKAGMSVTLILKDGTFVEGKVVTPTTTTVRIETRFGTRSYNRRDIEQAVEASTGEDGNAAAKFAELPPAIRAVMNAEADYVLGHYDKALARLEPFHTSSESPAVRIKIDWLLIEINERLGLWEKAKEQLNAKKEKGSPREKTRAKAHLDLFDANADYGLSFVNKKNARNFIKDDSVLARAREANSLKDQDIMRIALQEYCEQMLVEDDLGVKKFADKLKLKDTYDAAKQLPKTGDVEKALPYADYLKKAQDSLYKAQSILGDYGAAYELDLVRAEISHLIPVFDRLFNELIMVSPESFNPPFDPTTGRLTAPGREQWRQRCDQFLEQAQPVKRLIDYMVSKIERFPRELRDLQSLVGDLEERLDQMILGVKKARDRTDA